MFPIPMRHVFLLLLTVYFVAIIIPLTNSGSRDFHDFETYYFAGQAYAQGLNPYDLDVLRGVSAGTVQFPFLYPPLTLPIFQLFSLVNLELASQLFLVAKLITLGLLGVLWTRIFLRENDVAFPAFSLLAFNSAIYIDLSVGNISLFEQLLIWGGLWQYSRGRYLPFVAAIVCASFFKLTPILLLLLLLRNGLRRRELGWLLGSCTALGACLLTSYLIHSQFYVGFLSNLDAVSYLGVINPTSLTIYQYILRAMSNEWGASFPEHLSYWFYAVTVACVLACTVLAMRRIRARDEQDWRLPVLLVVTTYALVLPRLPDYGYILMLVPAYWAIRNTNSRAYPWLFVLMIHQAFNVRLPGAVFVYNILLAHMPLLMAYVTWGLLLRMATRPQPAAH